jgi:hypothetical protein
VPEGHFHGISMVLNLPQKTFLIYIRPREIPQLKDNSRLAILLDLPWSLFGLGGFGELGLVAAAAVDDEFWWHPQQQCSTIHRIPPEIVDSCRHLEMRIWQLILANALSIYEYCS